MSKYDKKGTLPFYFSRGCVFNCEFCSEKPNFSVYRCREPEEAFEELRAIIPYAQKYASVPTLKFSDSNFNVNIKKLEKFMDLILENNIKVKWGGQAHIQKNITYEYIKKMKKAGLVAVFWGIESGSQHVVDLMNKKYSHKDAARIFNDCNELGIMSYIPLIIGFPGETPEDIVDTLELIFNCKEKPFCEILMPGLLVITPNSPLYYKYAEFGLANRNRYDWYTTDFSNTLPIRIARRFVVMQAYGNDDLSVENIIDTEEIPVINIDESVVANDLFGMIHEAFLRSEETDLFYSAINQWSNNTSETSPKQSYKKDQKKEDYFQLWLQLDKNCAKGREKLYGLILTALKSFRNKVKNSQK
jgi:radical SAM superfamily enzyme YgiQ (UPF0313 family)